MLLVPSHIPSIITVSEKANSFLLQAPVTVESEHSGPWSMSGLHMVLIGNATELTLRRSPWPTTERKWVDKYSSFFAPWEDNAEACSLSSSLCHLPETPTWD